MTLYSIRLGLGAAILVSCLGGILFGLFGQQFHLTAWEYVSCLIAFCVTTWIYRKTDDMN